MIENQLHRMASIVMFGVSAIYNGNSIHATAAAIIMRKPDNLHCPVSDIRYQDCFPGC